MIVPSGKGGRIKKYLLAIHSKYIEGTKEKWHD